MLVGGGGGDRKYSFQVSSVHFSVINRIKVIKGVSVLLNILQAGGTCNISIAEVEVIQIL